MCRANPNDIVACNVRGREFYALVNEVDQERKGATINYVVEPITKGITYRRITSREIKSVYRKLGN